MPVRLFLALILIATAANARQPISTSLAECSGMFFYLDRSAKNHGKTAYSDRLQRAAKDFAAAAFKRARAEGVAHSDDVISGLIAHHTQNWESRMGDPLKASENIEWGKYCKALGREFGISFR